MESYTVEKVMSTNIKTITEEEKLSSILNLLQNSQHGGFPVINDQNNFVGLITRFELMMIICKGVTSRVLSEVTDGQLIDPDVEYSDVNKMRGHYMADPRINQGNKINKTHIFNVKHYRVVRPGSSTS